MKIITIEDNEIKKCNQEIINFDGRWVAVDDIDKRLHTVMNVRNNEKDMRLLIIEIQKSLSTLPKAKELNSSSKKDCYTGCYFQHDHKCKNPDDSYKCLSQKSSPS